MISEEDMEVCSYTTVVCLIESIDEDILYHDWLLAAEDFSNRNNELIELYKRKHINTVAFVKTALIGTQNALSSLSIDVTLVRSSWQDAVDTITSSEHDKALEKDKNVGDNLKGSKNLSERVVICGAKGVGNRAWTEVDAKSCGLRAKRVPWGVPCLIGRSIL